MNKPNASPYTKRSMKRQHSASSSPSYYVATSPSNRLNDHRRKRQNTTSQSKYPSLTEIRFRNQTSLYERLADEQPSCCKHISTDSRSQHGPEEGTRPPTYLLPTVSSLQRRTSLSNLGDINKTNIPIQDSHSAQSLETTVWKSPGHCRQAELKASVLLLEQDHQSVDRKQWMENESLMQLYGRYLQWEWLALMMEKTIRCRKLLVQNQMQDIRNSYKQANQETQSGPAYQRNDKVHHWMETYLGDVEKTLVLMENEQPTAEIKALCLSRLNIAKVKLDQLMDEGLAYSFYKENIDMINDSISCVKNIFTKGIDTSLSMTTDANGDAAL